MAAEASFYVAQLEGHPERLLLRAAVLDNRRAMAPAGRGERTSPKVASAAARILAAGRRGGERGPGKDELAVAASALTQAPDKKRR